MVIQNINGAYQNSLYITETEKNANVITQAASNDEYTVEKESINTDVLSLSTYQTPKILSTPTKIYIDNVINNALDNISRGNNIEDIKIVLIYRYKRY